MSQSIIILFCCLDGFPACSKTWSAKRLIPTGRSRLQRRMTRGCRSLERHAREISIGEGL